MEIGRRERKKQQTRQAISDVATGLFLERGFDAVTVAEVARAADVAVQTVFNHFPAKEDLFFDEDGWWVGPARAVRAAAGHPLDALEAHYLASIRERLAIGHLATWRQFVRTIDGSPALSARRRLQADQLVVDLAAALDERAPDRLRNRLLAAQYAAAQNVLEDELLHLLPEDATPAQLATAQQQLEEAVTKVFAILRNGLTATTS
ncbi:TetR/AcrR family transcriptional regulator [Kribbella sandramycini]|uniref:AcrR family transcriptional regulator n=1 Tax=Kribbella sandramycini TaxID=60450 RepID=A0A7Y4KWN9_9ACTN|nr:TetR/AcrR family transcriptional regulator [Kribbella sandramycini]MBB6567309.1 AcrR family transcriptional regulator [Kribbella sandramycini]NOL40079.1 TetR/AcrR family transcriptional regulator [Kribbella sandramycini]